MLKQPNPPDPLVFGFDGMTFSVGPCPSLWFRYGNKIKANILELTLGFFILPWRCDYRCFRFSGRDGLGLTDI
jgi:hypothetical protein